MLFHWYKEEVTKERDPESGRQDREKRADSILNVRRGMYSFSTYEKNPSERASFFV